MDFTRMSTKEFVDKVHEAQAHARENKEHNGYGRPAKRLPSKQGIR
ncbi:DUF4023 domain-containing protein [Brevibacillus composti]|uniref:DUF4023 domain-containing protein n=1 Tax=Brevibacillus composti TaxID=2796470 RepID=A0A7T5EK57_9BACL|nr:DUF4023 domain-containing protein [Brevibacillus composti]QQE74030.1 DUF4023 domain-containing protein [Brevibacillus composti]QUO41114.1 DUF4023 domain-containing protein [Brevibacillus composti]